MRNILVLTLAHELSHHFGKNDDNCPYAAEHYDGKAAALVGTIATYAAHNADNFGYYIEACS